MTTAFYCAIAATALLLTPTAGGWVNLDHCYSTEHLFWQFETGPAQRCYSISCFDDEASTIYWDTMQTHSWMVFYQGEFCQGEYIIVHQSANRIHPKNEMWHSAITPLLPEYKVERHNISSFMM